MINFKYFGQKHRNTINSIVRDLANKMRNSTAQSQEPGAI